MNISKQLAAYCTANPTETSQLVAAAVAYLLEQATPGNLLSIAAMLPSEEAGGSLANSLRILAEDRKNQPFSLGSK